MVIERLERNSTELFIRFALELENIKVKKAKKKSTLFLIFLYDCCKENWDADLGLNISRPSITYHIRFETCSKTVFYLMRKTFKHATKDL